MRPVSSEGEPARKPYAQYTQGVCGGQATPFLDEPDSDRHRKTVSAVSVTDICWSFVAGGFGNCFSRCLAAAAQNPKKSKEEEVYG